MIMVIVALTCLILMLIAGLFLQDESWRMDETRIRFLNKKIMELHEYGNQSKADLAECQHALREFSKTYQMIQTNLSLTPEINMINYDESDVETINHALITIEGIISERHPDIEAQK